MSTPELPAAEMQTVREYIKHAWTTLRRSNAGLLASADDPKVKAAAQLTLYIARDENPAQISARLQGELEPAAFKRVEVRALPDDPMSVSESGMLYLPEPYVVPGGRFNEMYGWDSYFALLGLVRDDELELARQMTDNFIYEIEHYGMVLNANRTYYLTRSQPPFVTRMLLEVFQRTADRDWLARAWPALEKYHGYWLREPHMTPRTGLSRFHGMVAAPAPEVMFHEVDEQGANHYDRVREYYRTHQVTEYDVSRFYDFDRDSFTDDFYYGDRAVRESGFDLSARFGPFSTDIISHNSVDINVLLYQMERDMAEIAGVLGKSSEVKTWTERADWRGGEINRLMWNEAEGLYFDYNFEKDQQSSYHFNTTFYPLWAGIASQEQAARVAANLPVFEREWGLEVSDRHTQHQWDGPFGWAPMHIMAVAGMRRYGFHADADRVSRKFLACILRDFARHGTIMEKYDVIAGESDLGDKVKFGYLSNEVGFAWTNAAFLIFADELERKVTPPLQAS